MEEENLLRFMGYLDAIVMTICIVGMWITFDYVFMYMFYLGWFVTVPNIYYMDKYEKEA